jgi:hypothetical protein
VSEIKIEWLHLYVNHYDEIQIDLDGKTTRVRFSKCQGSFCLEKNSP